MNQLVRPVCIQGVKVASRFQSWPQFGLQERETNHSSREERKPGPLPNIAILWFWQSQRHLQHSRYFWHLCPLAKTRLQTFLRTSLAFSQERNWLLFFGVFFTLNFLTSFYLLYHLPCILIHGHTHPCSTHLSWPHPPKSTNSPAS